MLWVLVWCSISVNTDAEVCGAQVFHTQKACMEARYVMRLNVAKCIMDTTEMGDKHETATQSAPAAAGSDVRR